VLGLDPAPPPPAFAPEISGQNFPEEISAVSGFPETAPVPGFPEPRLEIAPPP